MISDLAIVLESLGLVITGINMYQAIVVIARPGQIATQGVRTCTTDLHVDRVE